MVYLDLKRGDVVQFLEGHKWCGCFGWVDRVYPDKILIGVPMPTSEAEGVTDATFVYVNHDSDEYALIGFALMMPIEEEE